MKYLEGLRKFSMFLIGIGSLFLAAYCGYADEISEPIVKVVGIAIGGNAAVALFTNVSAALWGKKK